jgi:hypothetical protein
MDISAKLADLNWQRIQIGKRLLLKMRPAIMLLMEMLYRRGCLFDSYRKVRKLQDSLRILSFIWVVETVGFNPGLSIRDGDEVR